MPFPLRVSVWPVRAIVRCVSVRNESAAASAVTTISPNTGPLPGILPVTAQRPARRGDEVEADHVNHSGVTSGNAFDKYAIALSIGCRVSGGRPSGVGSVDAGRERRKPCPLAIG